MSSGIITRRGITIGDPKWLEHPPRLVYEVKDICGPDDYLVFCNLSQTEFSQLSIEWRKRKKKLEKKGCCEAVQD